MAVLQVVPISGAAVCPSPVPVGAVALPPVPHPLTLYALEETLTILADTEDMVPEEQRAEFQEEFRLALTAAVEKRDRVGAFLAHLENQAAFAKAETSGCRNARPGSSTPLDLIHEPGMKVLHGFTSGPAFSSRRSNPRRGLGRRRRWLSGWPSCSPPPWASRPYPVCWRPAATPAP